MQITVFGASGKVGHLVVDKLLANGHAVTVLVHHNGAFVPNPKLGIVTGDVHDPLSIEQALKGAEAVISTLGSWGTPTKDILSAAMQAAIPIMERRGVKRFITLTGSGAWAPDDTITVSNKIAHAAFSVIAKEIIRDAETHLQLLHNSKLEWTCLRAPVMRSATTTNYVLNHKLPTPWETIPRHAVAQAIVDQLEDREHLFAAPQLHSR